MSLLASTFEVEVSPSMSRSRDAMLRSAAVLALLIVHSSAVLADCRAEVEAAFQKLQMPGRPYRRVTTMASFVHVADSRGFQFLRETAEFILPDRKRRILDYVGDQPPSAWIRVGERTWMREGQQWLEGYGWMDTDIFLRGVWSPQTSFECLGAVAFEGKTYIGYGANDPRPGILMGVGKIGPKLWRTILVDGQTGLPVYEIYASQLDSPIWKIQYTYPRDITIEPPVR
jgi:hypothetical protein